MTSLLLWLLGAALVVVGIIGTVLPALPGPILVFAGLVLAAWADDFTKVGAFTLVLLGLMTAVTHIIELVATAKGAKHFGASRRAAIGAGLGALAGLFFGLPGLVIGPFIGAVVGEYTVQRQLMPAGRAGLGAWIGLLVGMILKLGMIAAMLAVFLAAFWWR